MPAGTEALRSRWKRVSPGRASCHVSRPPARAYGSALVLALGACADPELVHLRGPDWRLDPDAAVVITRMRPDAIDAFAKARGTSPAVVLGGRVLAFQIAGTHPCQIVLPAFGTVDPLLLAALEHHQRLHCAYGRWHDEKGEWLR